ncbi:hypothetical protein LO772_05155 [Yinghuangia sp. ASG 101]|uniref:hypothetical protein n=1 Tax=Yinghuangia sp. ASG 101 TaxID=2896848 RepID=UPI001E33513F|nr:hypothetical protein [Yinghuangia sp. ASG 101]UGQ13013.1 hypothetical protein LO772_05155 [Yinghuangia sp. ASG 101]
MAAEGEPMPNWAFLGACIRRDRKARSWTQGDLAGHAGLALRTIGKYERGEGGQAGEGVPSGYFAVGRALGWRHGAVEECLFGADTNPESATDPGSRYPAPASLFPDTPGASGRPTRPGCDPLIAAYRGVQDFLVLAVERGASPSLIRRFSDTAGDLLEAVAVGSGIGDTLGLSADSPLGAPPADDDAIRALAATSDLPDIQDHQ